MVGKDRVVKQSIVPGSTSCSEIFLETWKIVLSSKWNQVESILKSKKSILFLVPEVLIYFVFRQFPLNVVTKTVAIIERASTA